MIQKLYHILNKLYTNYKKFVEKVQIFIDKLPINHPINFPFRPIYFIISKFIHDMSYILPIRYCRGDGSFDTMFSDILA